MKKKSRILNRESMQVINTMFFKVHRSFPSLLEEVAFWNGQLQSVGYTGVFYDVETEKLSPIR